VRRFGCPIDRTLRTTLLALVADSLSFLDALLHSRQPALRLLWPRRGEPYSHERHERLGRKASHQPRDVQAILFPGLIDLSQGPCLARALVATQRQRPD
jgi:hypothetical protein